MDPISISIGTGEYQARNLSEALSLVLSQLGGLGHKCRVCGTFYALVADQESSFPRAAWTDLPLHSIASGLETRRCPCGSHLAIAVEFMEARPGLPAAFGEARDPEDAPIEAAPEPAPSNPGIYGSESWGCPGSRSVLLPRKVTP